MAAPPSRRTYASRPLRRLALLLLLALVALAGLSGGFTRDDEPAPPPAPTGSVSPAGSRAA